MRSSWRSSTKDVSLSLPSPSALPGLLDESLSYAKGATRRQPIGSYQAIQLRSPTMEVRTHTADSPTTRLRSKMLRGETVQAGGGDKRSSTRASRVTNARERPRSSALRLP